MIYSCMTLEKALDWLKEQNKQPEPETIVIEGKMFSVDTIKEALRNHTNFED